jgi:predicted ABC-type ATPase
MHLENRLVEQLTASPIAAGREVLRLAKEYLERHQSFSIETTRSGKNYFEMMNGARTLGFEIVLERRA